jgi:pyruvate/2-oxoglutarate/acetoin dehydrogenase E1 component
MFMDFITLAMDQIANHAAKFRYVYGSQVCVPMVIRTPAGGGRSYGATHSQSLEALFLHVPGIKIVTPSTPADAKGLLKASIRDDNPVLFVEHKRLYAESGPVDDGQPVPPIGRAVVRRQGSDVTVVSYSYHATVAMAAAEQLARDGIDAEVMDLRTLAPMDTEAILESVRKTGRLVIVEEGTRTGGVGAEVAARVAEGAYEYLDAPIRRVAAVDVPIPFSAPLEEAMLPDTDAVTTAVRGLFMSSL